jgi:hypothetical protein
MQNRKIEGLQRQIEELKAERAAIGDRARAPRGAWLPRIGASRRVRFALAAALVAVPVAAFAATISMPYSFSNGTIADANEVNANFDTLVVESNAQHGRIAALEGDLTSHAAGASAHHTKTTTLAWSAINSKPAGFDDGIDDDALGALFCAAGQLPKWNGSSWACGEDLDTDTDTDTLGALSCAAGQLPKWNASAWTCAQDIDTNTTYSAGTGLSLGGTTFGVQVPLSLTGSSYAATISATSTSPSDDSPAIYGVHAVTDYYGVGVEGAGLYMGVKGTVNATGSSNYYGVFGDAYTSSGSGTTHGLYGSAAGGGTNYGVYGSAAGGSNRYGVYGTDGSNYGYLGSGSYGVYGSNSSGTAVYGNSTSGTGVYGYSYGGTAVAGRDGSGGAGLAGYFDGNVSVVGSLSKGGGSFKIDHPLDPEGKFLSHSFVESPDMLNVYNGNVVLDESGEAVVELPKWFEVLNRDFRYQLTPIGAPGPELHVAAEVSQGRFAIAGGTPGGKVSWQVTGIRQDPYANAHPIAVEEAKSPGEIGYYLHPEVYGQPREKGIDRARELAMARP